MLKRIARITRRIFSKVYATYIAIPRMNRIDRVRMFGFDLTIPPTVFHPKLFFTTKVFARYLNTLDLKELSVLEIGCGSGVLSLVAARRGGIVTAVDINPAAVEAANRNVVMNGLDAAIRVMQSDLFERLESASQFDLIIFNPPYYKRNPANDTERAFFAGENLETIRRFAAEACTYLTEDGRILFLLTSDVDINAIMSIFESTRLIAREVKRTRRWFEVLTIFELTQTTYSGENEKR